MKSELITAAQDSIANKFDSLIAENQQNFETLTRAIYETSKSEKLFNIISYDTAFTVFITTIVIVLIELIKWIVSLRKQFNSKQKFRNFFFTKIEELLEYTPKIVKQYRETSITTSFDNGLDILPIQVQKADFRILLNIDSQELHKNFKDKKTTFAIYSEIEAIYELILLYEKFHDRINTGISKFREELRELSIELRNIIEEIQDELRPHIKFDSVKDANYQFFLNKIITYNKDIDKQSLTDFSENFLIPIYKYINEQNLSDTNKSAGEFIKLFRRFHTIFLILKYEINDYKKYLSSTGTTIEEQCTKIKNNKIKLKKGATKIVKS